MTRSRIAVTIGGSICAALGILNAVLIFQERPIIIKDDRAQECLRLYEKDRGAFILTRENVNAAWILSNFPDFYKKNSWLIQQQCNDLGWPTKDW